MEDEDSECVMGGAMADSVVDEHTLSSLWGPEGMSMPVLIGDSWPFRGRRMAVGEEDEVEEGVRTVVVVAGSMWWWW